MAGILAPIIARNEALRLADLQHRESLRFLNRAHARTLRLLEKARVEATLPRGDNTALRSMVGDLRTVAASEKTRRPGYESVNQPLASVKP